MDNSTGTQKDKNQAHSLRKGAALYESNNGLPETESFRRGHGGLGSRGSLSADRNSRLC